MKSLKFYASESAFIQPIAGIRVFPRNQKPEGRLNSLSLTDVETDEISIVVDSPFEYFISFTYERVSPLK